MSVETYGFKFVVDAKDAAKGYGDFQKAVDGVFASLSKFEAHAKKTMDSVTASSKKGQSDIAKYTSQFRALANIPIDGRAAPRIADIGRAMGAFRAPNSTQVTNLRAFYKALGTMPNMSDTARTISNIARLSTALNGFKAPSSAQAKRLVEFAKAMESAGPALSRLRGVAGVSGIANELASISIALSKLKIPSATAANNLKLFGDALQHMKMGHLTSTGELSSLVTAIARFRAPTKAQTDNLRRFIDALNNLKVPTNGAALAAYLRQISSAATVANTNLKGFRGSMNSLQFGGLASGARKAHVEMMGLQNAFSGTFQVGSLLRSLLGSLTIGELGRSFFEAQQMANQFHASMMVLTEDPKKIAQSWARVKEDADHFGADLNTFSEGFSKFAVAAHESGATLEQTFRVYEGFQNVMTALHLGTQQQQSVGLAIREIMDKGYVSTQQLTRQLGLVLPGAVSTLQKAVKDATGGVGNLWDMLKNKQINGMGALLVLADHYKNKYGPAVNQALESPIQQFTRIKNRVTELMVAVGEAGAMKAFATLLKNVADKMDPARMQGFVHSLSKGLSDAARKAGDAFKWLYNNWDSIKGPLSTTLSLMGKWMLITSALKLGQFLINPLISARTALMGVNDALTKGFTRVPGTFTAIGASLQPLPVGLARLNVGLTAATVGTNALTLAGRGLMGVGRGLISLIGGPWVAAALVLFTVYKALTGGTANLAAVQADLKSHGEELDGAIQQLNQTYGINFRQAGNAANANAGMGASAAGAVGGINNAGNAAMTAAEKFHVMAQEARKADIALAQLQMDNAKKDAKGALLQTNEGAADDFNKGRSRLWFGLRSHKSIGDWFGSAANKIEQTGSRLWTNGQNNTDANAALATARKQYWEALHIKQRIEQMTDDQVATGHGLLKPGAGGADPGLIGEGKTKKKKKGRKGPTERQLETRLADADDSIMGMLLNDDTDPKLKLFADQVKQITKLGEGLLNDGSFKTFFHTLGADAEKGTVSVDALVHALQNGGIKGKVLADLKARYHTDVQGIIKLLYQSQRSYEDAVKEATVKKIETENRSVNDLMKRLAKDDPVLAVYQEQADDITKMGQHLLTDSAFATWYRETEESADGAATAITRLLALLKDSSSLDKDMMKRLLARGGSMDDVVGSLQERGQRTEHDVAKARRSTEFGTDMRRDMATEARMGELNTFQQTVANKVLEEYNRLRNVKRGAVVTQAEIDTLKEEVTAHELLMDRLKQQREFFENNGIQSYVRDLKTAGEAIHEMDNHFLKNMEDTLYTLGTTGKLSFKSLLDGIQSDIIRFSSQQLTKKLVTMLVPNFGSEKNPSIFGGLLGKLGGMDKNDFYKKPMGTQTQPFWVKIIGERAEAGVGPVLKPGQVFAPDELSTDLIDPKSQMNQVLDDLLGPSGLPDVVKKGVTSGVQGASTPITTIFTKVFGGLGSVFGGIFSSIMSLIGGAGKGIGGLLGSLLGHGGGGGGMPDIGFLDNLMAGVFQEGGEVGRAVSSGSAPASMFFNAPKYREGTPNTSMMDGGHPAILHDNEAVIPLSRGRKVAVELTGASSHANGTVIHNNFNVNSPDADSFRRSQSQIATDMHMSAARAWHRTNR